MSLFLDFSPGPAAVPFRISPKDWATVNQRVAVVLQSPRGGTANAFYRQLITLPNYPALLASARDWKATNFDALISFASSLAGFGGDEVKQRLSELAPAVQRLAKNDASAGVVVSTLVKALQARISNLRSQAEDLAVPLRVLDQQMTLANVARAGSADPIWNAFSENAGMAFDEIAGRFALVCAQLGAVQVTIETNLAKDLPVVINLVDLPDVEREWADAAALAETFAAQAETQRNFLVSDDWQYKDPPLIPGAFRYRLISRSTRQSLDLKAATGKPGVPVLAAGQAIPTQCWKVERMGAGFYQMRVEAQPDWALDTYGGQSHQCFLAATVATGQFWRFVPADDGWYRLCNLYLGEDWALQPQADGTLWMEPTADGEAQHFQVSDF